MKMETLDIGIPAGRNSEYYVSLLVSSIEKYTSDKIDYRYILGINNSGVSFEYFENLFKLLNIKNYKIVKKIEKSSGISNGHGKCLDLILNTMTAKYGVFFDSDVCVLAQDWDQLMISEIDEKNIIIGSEYHPGDGKIVNFPNVITCLFDVEKFKQLNISFVPKLINLIADEKDANYYGVSVGQQVFLDTGCHIAKTIKQAGYNGKVLKLVSPRYEDTLSQLRFMKKDMRGEEYQLNGQPISTHLGRSSSRSFLNDPIVINWRRRIDEWAGKIS